MGFMSFLGDIAWDVTKVAAKATYVVTKYAATAIYDHRDGIGSAVVATAKLATTLAITTTKVAYGVKP